MRELLPGPSAAKQQRGAGPPGLCAVCAPRHPLLRPTHRKQLALMLHEHWAALGRLQALGQDQLLQRSWPWPHSSAAEPVRRCLLRSAWPSLPTGGECPLAHLLLECPVATVLLGLAHCPAVRRPTAPPSAPAPACLAGTETEASLRVLRRGEKGTVFPWRTGRNEVRMRSGAKMMYFKRDGFYKKWSGIVEDTERVSDV